MNSNIKIFPQFKKLSKHSIYYSFGNVAVRFLSFLLLPLYTRFLSPEEYGIIYTALITSFFIGIILDFRQNASVLRIYYDYKDKPKQLKSYLGSVFIFSILSSVLIIGLLLLKGRFIFDWLFSDIDFYPYIFLVLIYTFFHNSLTFPMMLFRVREQALRYAFFNIANFLLTTGFIIYFVVVLSSGALGYIKGSLYAAVIFFIIYLVLALKEINLRFSWTLLKPGLKYGIPLIPLAISTWVIQGSDRFFLARYSTLTNVGLYSLAYNISSAVGMVVFSISQAWEPFFFSIAKIKEEVNRIVPTLVTYFLLLVSLVILGLSLFSKEILFIMTDAEYHTAYFLMPIIASVFLFEAIFIFSARGISFLKKVYIISAVNILMALVNIFLNYLWVPIYDMKGAAFATLIAYMFKAIIIFIFSQKLYRINYEFKRIFMIIFFGLIFFMLGIFLNQLEISIKYTLIKFILIIGFVFSLYFAKFFKPEEIAMGRLFLQRLKLLKN